jgi:broad specificity phosphatase PhoE
MIVGLRHAEVWNPGGIVYGRLPGYGLSDRGERKARDLASTLAGTRVRAVFASPLQRAMETAAILAEPHDLRPTPDERLSEWAFWGNWEGMRWTDIHQRDPEVLQAYAEDAAVVTLGEPLSAAAERVLEWAAWAEGTFQGDLVLGVSHESPLAGSLLLGSGRDLTGYHALTLPHLSTVRLRPGPAEIVDLAAWAVRC